MHGRDQTQAMTKLTGDQLTPAQLAGIRIGDCVRLPNVDVPLRVIGLQDPLLILESPSGHQVRAGWRAVTLESPGKLC